MENSAADLGADSYHLLIDGSHVDAIGGGEIPIVNPNTEETIATVPRARADDIQTAVEAAQSAEREWARMSGADRSQALLAVADAIRDRADVIAEIDSMETGKPLSIAKHQVSNCARAFEYYAGAADKIYGDYIPISEEYVDFTIREPKGITAQIIPWNGPTALFGRSVAPALAAGNVSVVKPAEQAPLGILEVADAVDEHLPDGVLNVVPGYGDEAGAPLVEHEAINSISFTGSTETGRYIAKSAAENLTPVHLELGGKSPNVVYPDADLERAAEQVINGFTLLTGQACIAGSRLVVHEDIREEFVDLLAQEVESLSVDDGPTDPDLGPLVSDEQFDKVKRYLNIGCEEVGDPVTGGDLPDRDGYFVEPTIFDGVGNDMRIAREEIFGPVLSVIPFETEAEAIEIANDTNYGLYAGVFTEDIGRALRFSKAVESGNVGINEFTTLDDRTPFGGYKDSGYGREGGLEALKEYTQVKNVVANIDTVDGR